MQGFGSCADARAAGAIVSLLGRSPGHSPGRISTARRRPRQAVILVCSAESVSQSEDERVSTSRSATSSSSDYQSPTSVTERWFADFFTEVVAQERQETKLSVRQKARLRDALAEKRLLAGCQWGVLGIAAHLC